MHPSDWIWQISLYLQSVSFLVVPTFLFHGLILSELWLWLVGVGVKARRVFFSFQIRIPNLYVLMTPHYYLFFILFFLP